jgi:urease gamma subunit
MATRRPLEGVLYKISPTLALQRARLVHVLEANGATAAKSMSEATHVLTDSLVFEGSEDVQKDALVTVCPLVSHWCPR